MKTLLKSPKFWAVTFGIIIGSAVYYFLGDGKGLGPEYPMLVVGAYSSIALAGKANDIAKSFKGKSDA